REMFPIQRVDLPALTRRSEGKADRSLRQPVDGRHDIRPEAVAGESALELRHRLRADRLGAVEGEAPGRQVESLELVPGKAPEAKLVGEIGAAGDRAAMAVDRAQPLARPRKKSERRHQHHRKAE